MKGRTVSLAIVLVLLNYLIFSAIYTMWGGRSQPAPTPTRTPKPTYTLGAEAKVLYVTATATERAVATPTETPLPPTSSPVPTDTPAPTQAPATDTPAPASATPVPTSTTPAPTSTTPAATVAPSPVGTSFIHVVVAGESLTSIAAQYGVTIEAIVEANGLKSANQVFIGQHLIIPSPAPTPTAGPTRRTHTVKAGEALSLIAAQYGVSTDALMKANNLTDADVIYAGQVLIIP